MALTIYFELAMSARNLSIKNIKSVPAWLARTAIGTADSHRFRVLTLPGRKQVASQKMARRQRE